MRLKFFHTSSSSSTRSATLTGSGVAEFQHQQQNSDQYPVTEPRRGPRRNQARQHPSVMQMFDQTSESIPMQREHSAGSTSSSSHHSSLHHHMQQQQQQQQPQHLMPNGFVPAVEPTSKRHLRKQEGAQRPAIRSFHSFTSSSSSCTDSDYEELDEPQEPTVVEPKKEIATALSPPPPHKHRPALSKRDPPHTKLHRVIQEENERLREQIGRLREEARRDRVNQQAALVSARRETKYLQRTLARIQRVQESQDASHATRSQRRRSTGSSEHIPIFGMLNKSDLTVVPQKQNNTPSFMSHLRPAVPVEKKLSILLDEIEAMQLEEDAMQEKCDQLAHSNAELEQELDDRDETIRQLEHDLRVQSLRSRNHSNNSTSSSPSGSITRA